MLIDTHCHLNSLSLEQIDLVTSSFPKDAFLIDASIDYESSIKSLEVSSQYPFVYSSLGFHPFSVNRFNPDLIEKYRELIKINKKIVAIGEIGLDHKADAPLEKQAEILGEFIGLAKQLNLPVLIHNRLDSLKIIEVLDGFFSSYEKVVFHCFSYSPQFLAKIIERKAFVSFSLNVLRNDPKIIASLKECPIQNLLLETDSPYMRIKGKISSPLDIERMYPFAASVKEIDRDKLEEAVWQNAQRAFNLGNRQ